jgi:carbon starvation protein
MFGIANQLLAVLALALVTTWLVNNGRSKYTAVTITPMTYVTSTTLTAGYILVTDRFPKMIDKGREMVEKGTPELVSAGNKMIITAYLSSALTLFVITCVLTLLFWCVARWYVVWLGWAPPLHATPENGKPNGAA